MHGGRGGLLAIATYAAMARFMSAAAGFWRHGLELRVLRYIVAVSDTGSMTAAARREHVAQPSLSRQIRSLEQSLGIEIFRRSGKRLEVTPIGERFVQDARDLVMHAESLETATRRGYSVEDLSVVCTPQLFDSLVAPFAMSGNFPVKSLVIRESNLIADFLNEGHADMGLSPVRSYKGLSSALVTEIPLSLQIHPAIDPFEEGMVSLSQVRDELNVNLISLFPSRETRRAFDRLCISNSIAIEISHEVETAQVAQLVAATTRSACVVADNQPKFGLHSHPLTSRLGQAALPIFAVWKPDHAMAPEMRQLIAGLDAPH